MPSGTTLPIATTKDRTMATVIGEATAPSSAGLLRTREVLAILEITDPTLRSWLKAGKFPAPTARLGNSPRWDREVVESFVRGRWTPAT